METLTVSDGRRRRAAGPGGEIAAGPRRPISPEGQANGSSSNLSIIHRSAAAPVERVEISRQLRVVLIRRREMRQAEYKANFAEWMHTEPWAVVHAELGHLWRRQLDRSVRIADLLGGRETLHQHGPGVMVSGSNGVVRLLDEAFREWRDAELAELDGAGRPGDGLRRAAAATEGEGGAE